MKPCLNLTLNKLYQQLYFIWFTQELDYKAIYTALTALKVTSTFVNPVAVEVFSHLLDTSDLKSKISHFYQQAVILILIIEGH